MVIWDYSELNYSWIINVLALTSNAEAIAGRVFLEFYNYYLAFLNSSSLTSFMVLSVGLLFKFSYAYALNSMLNCVPPIFL